MLAFVTLLVVAAPAPPIRVLVLELEGVGVDPTIARSVDALVVQGASIDGVEVVTQAEIKKLASLDAAKAEMDCNAASCLSELAYAMGAQLVIFGSVSQLGTTTTVSLSLFDQRSAQIRRENVNTSDVGKLPADLPPHVRTLLEPSLPKPEPVAPTPGPSPLFLAGIGGVGVGGLALMGGIVGAVVTEGRIQEPTAPAADKRSAQTFGRIAVLVAGIGALAVGGGVACIALGVE